jgi:hypothetical protein
MEQRALNYVGAFGIWILGSVISNSAVAQTLPTLTEKNIPCSEFKKLPDGQWILKGPIAATIGSVKEMTLQDYEISPTTVLGGVNIYSLLEKHCGPPH